MSEMIRLMFNMFNIRIMKILVLCLCLLSLMVIIGINGILMGTQLGIGLLLPSTSIRHNSRRPTITFEDNPRFLVDLVQDSTTLAQANEEPNNLRDKDWNKTALLSLRRRLTAICNISQDIFIYDSDVKAENMDFTNHSTKLNRTHGIPRQSTCAIIGNGGILFNSGCGHEIDTHDFVMRTNLPELRGYEDDVGKKQNMTSLNHHATMALAKKFLSTSKSNASIQDRESTIQRLKDLDGSVIWHPLGPSGLSRRKFQTIISNSRFTSIHLQVGYATKSIMDLGRKFWHTRLPSSGLAIFTAAVAFCDNISLYGFYPFHIDRYNNSLRYHYYEDIQFNFDTNVHKMPEEYIRLTELHKEGVIRLVTDKCQIYK